MPQSKPNRRDFMKITGAGLAASCARSKRPQQPNVLFISVDDLNSRIGCYGDPVAKTPNIDALAGQGVRFEHGFSQWPSCLPSRASFMSGWHPERTRVFTFEPKARDGVMKDAVYLGQHFRNHGYFTSRIDKIFHIGADDPISWDESHDPFKDENGQNRIVRTTNEVVDNGLEDNVIEQGQMTTFSGEKGNYAIVDAEDDKLIDGINTNRAIGLLEKSAESGQPFFMALGLRRPHLPWIAPKKYWDMYPREEMTLPPMEPDLDPAKKTSEDEHRRSIAGYYACVSFTDALVGRVLGTLDRLDMRENTIVVLFGDQGYLLGERNSHFGKGGLYDLSFRVPVIISVPWMDEKDAVCRRSVQLLDLYPTLVELAGLQPPEHGLQGRSLVPLINNPQADWDSRAVSFSYSSTRYGGLAISIRDDQYRYSENADGVPIELYDYKTDPNEWNNVIQDSAYAQTLKNMQEKLGSRALYQ
jgi:iduronate 2-sulfatase